MVKNLLQFICILAFWFNPCYAQTRSVERIYISTDRDVYVAGETIWLSLYNFDMNRTTHRFSDLSCVAYVELRSDESLMCSVKLRINQGRGSGRMELPPSLPTGNYRLIAYTKQMINEKDISFFDKIIPIYNTLSLERIPQNVAVREEEGSDISHSFSKVDSKVVDVKWGIDRDGVPRNFSAPISLINKSDEEISLNISIVRADIPAPQEFTIQDFLNGKMANPASIEFVQRYIPEFEGEIISGRMTNKEEIISKDKSIYLSAVGPSVEIYASSVDSLTGNFSFFTNSLYGKREIAIECPSAQEAIFELFDPFVKPPVAPVPILYLDKRYEPYLTQRSIGMQMSRRFGIDTLYSKTTIFDDPFFYNNKPIIYTLDNYTRFPAISDIMIEYISEMRFRRSSNQWLLQILLETGFGRDFIDGPLIVIDGIAIFDHELLLKYDPLKVETLSIYQSVYRIGNTIFNGIAKWNTYTGKYPGLNLGKNAMIVDFEGVQYPSRFTGREVATNENVPDVRTLLYWDPQIELKLGEECEIVFSTSSIRGDYVIIMEGVTQSGQPIYYRSEFTVK